MGFFPAWVNISDVGWASRMPLSFSSFTFRSSSAARKTSSCAIHNNKLLRDGEHKTGHIYQSLLLVTIFAIRLRPSLIRFRHRRLLSGYLLHSGFQRPSPIS